MKSCNRCGKPIGFKLLKSGSWLPIDSNGQAHWKTCNRVLEPKSKVDKEYSQDHISQLVRAICA